MQFGLEALADVAVNILLESKHCAYRVSVGRPKLKLKKSVPMNFWKIVRNLIEQWLPDWRDQFLAYKALKKQLKITYPTSDSYGHDQTTKMHKLDPDQSSEMVDFVKWLDCEIDKLNLFFIKKEEEYLRRLTDLPDRIAEARESRDRIELMKICREVADFHAEMVLLENYSAINYIGFVKFVKKYDKRSGNTILLPFIQKLQKQPFFSTDVLGTLVYNCQTLYDLVLEHVDGLGVNGDDDEEEILLGMDTTESRFFKLVQLAFKVLKEIRGGSKTKSVFSLPPMQD